MKRAASINRLKIVFILLAVAVSISGGLFQVTKVPLGGSIVLSSSVDSKSNQQIQDQVGRSLIGLNSSQLSLAAGNQTPEYAAGYCQSGNCFPRVQNLQYENCSSDEYMQRQIQMKRDQPEESLFRMLSKHQPLMPRYLEESCVYNFMTSFPKGSNKSSSSLYKSCRMNSQGKEMVTPALRPCAGESYVNLITNSFNVAATCMSHISNGIIHTAAKLFPHESGFHINAARPGGHDSGVGQLISISIRDVNQGGERSALNRIRSSMSSNPNQACQQINQEILSKQPPLSDSNQKSCDRMTLSNGNPLLNNIYSLELLKLKQERIDRMIFNNRQFSGKFSLNRNGLDEIREAVLIYAYNLGEGVASAVRATINGYGNQKITNSKEFIRNLKQEVAAYAAQTSRQQGSAEAVRTGRVKSQYLDQVLKRFNMVNDNLTARGGKCLRNP